MEREEKKMPRTGFAQPVFCTLADKAALSTTALRFCCGTVVFFSVIAAMMDAVALGIDSTFEVQNHQNVYYINESLEAASSSSSRSVAVEGRALLLPEVSATVGLHTVCVSHSCFPRSSLSGVLPLVGDNIDKSIESLLPSSVLTAYDDVLNQFVFGYDIGESCGTPRESTRTLLQVGVGMIALSLLLLIAMFSVSMPLFVLLSGVDVLVGSPALDSESQLVIVEVLDLPGRYVAAKVRQHLKWEQPLLTTLTLLSFLGFALNICSIASSVALVEYRTKCGKIVCDAFTSAMDQFYAMAEENSVKISSPHSYTCRNGNAYKLVIVSFTLCGACCFVSISMVVIHRCFHRGRTLAAMQDQLRRLEDVQELAAGGDSHALSQLSRHTSAQLTKSSLQLPIKPDGRSPSGLLRSQSALGSKNGAWRGRMAPFPPSDDAIRQSRSIGSRIELYRLLKQFCTVEEHCRRVLETSESIGFQEFLALRETAWFDEELCMLHKFTLDWFVGPSLDLCVLETHSRQQIIAEYGAGVSDMLAGLGTGTRVASRSSAPQRRDRHELNGKETSLLKQRGRRCQQTQALMRRAFQRTASYDVPAAALPMQQLVLTTSTSGPMLPAELNTDAWIRRLEELRKSFVPGPFLAALGPELRQDSEVLWSESELGTSGYSVPRSPGPRGGVGAAAFASEDAVRLHLCKSAAASAATSSATTLTPSSTVEQLADGPPQRLVVLPQHANAHGCPPQRRLSAQGPQPTGRVSDGAVADTHSLVGEVSAESIMFEAIPRAQPQQEGRTDAKSLGPANGTDGGRPNNGLRGSGGWVRGGFFGAWFGGKNGNGDSATRRSRNAAKTTAPGPSEGSSDRLTPLSV